jgi:hypothetical protein
MLIHRLASKLETSILKTATIGLTLLIIGYFRFDPTNNIENYYFQFHCTTFGWAQPLHL